MFLSSATDIRVETTGYDVSYFLPARPLGKLRWIGFVFVAFGLFFVWRSAAGLLRDLGRFSHTEQPGFEWMSLSAQLFFVVVSSIPACLGLLIAFGRSRVDWRNGRLSVLEHAGLIRWRRRLPKEPVRKFTVRFGGAAVNDQPVTTGPLADLGALTAEYDQGKPRLVAIGYPRDWLQALAEDLSTRVGASASALSRPAVEVVDAMENQPQFLDVTEQPPGSQVEIQRRASGIAIVIPPAGLRKGSKGLFSFAIFWCLFMVVFTSVVVASTLKKSGTPWFAWLFIMAFWGIGLGLLAAAINMGRRRATLSTESGVLRVTQTGPFGTKDREWRRGEVSAIRADASGMEVNDVPIIELQIHPVVGKKAGYFAGRDEQELRWLATELRRALNVPAKTI
jgi:hypothetical protein